MQFLTIALTGNKVSLLKRDYDDLSTCHSITATDELKRSKLWMKINNSLRSEAFQKGNIYYNHRNGFDLKVLTADQKFSKNGIVTATSVSKHGVEFVAAIEHKSYPFFGFQFHPEKNQFERIGPTFLERDLVTLEFCRELMWSILNETRQHAKELQEIDPFVRAFFEIYHTPVRPSVDLFETVYIFQSLTHPSLMREKL